MGTPDPLLSRGLWVFVCVWPSTFNLLVLSIFFLNGDTTMIFCQLSIKTDTFHIKCVHSQFNFFFCSSLWIFQFLVNLLGLLARYHKTWGCLLLLEKSHFQWEKYIFCPKFVSGGNSLLLLDSGLIWSYLSFDVYKTWHPSNTSEGYTSLLPLTFSERLMF